MGLLIFCPFRASFLLLLAKKFILTNAVEMIKRAQLPMDRQIVSFSLLTQWVRDKEIQIKILTHDFSRGVR